jgi:hypothetical protein
MSTQLAHGFLDQHGAHLSVILVPTLLMVGLALGAEVRTWHRRRRVTNRKAATGLGSIRIAAHFSVVAGLIHLAVGPAHFEEAVVYGGFFVAVAFAQVAWAMAVVARHDAWIVYLGIVGNALVIGLWLVTRTIGIPLGPEAGQVEAVGALDIVSAVLEVGVIVGSLRAMHGRAGHRVLAV